MEKQWARRTFMSSVSGILTVLGVEVSSVHAQGTGSAFVPLRHNEDAWFDSLPGSHRVFVDSASPEGAADAVRSARNFYRASASGYGLRERDLAVIVCLRHRSVMFAFDDAMWAKYGKQWSADLPFVDPRTKQPATSNVLIDGLQELAKMGAHFAVCNLSTRARARAAAEAAGTKEDTVYEELVAHMIPSSHVVAAGVVAAAHAQEHGYSFLANP